MAMDASEIERLIRAGIPDAEVRLEDLRGDGDHYAAYVVSPTFRGKTRVQQHQMVYQALQGNMGAALQRSRHPDIGAGRRLTAARRKPAGDPIRNPKETVMDTDSANPAFERIRIESNPTRSCCS